MISKLSRLFKKKKPAVVEPTTLWTEIKDEQQEAMKGGWPWPGFPPTGGGGGGSFNGSSNLR
ncbi:MAG: hypothetical protein AAFZ80_11000 [Cyanobacteria bacterium P01_A01_bin.105]